MTPRKELYTKIKDKLNSIPLVELVDLDKNQIEGKSEVYGQLYTACFIKIEDIQWQSMTNQMQEGNGLVTIKIITKDGFLDHFAGTQDIEKGFNEIDLIDMVNESLQFLKGDLFTQLELVSEGDEDIQLPLLMGYRLSFQTRIIRRLTPRYIY